MALLMLNYGDRMEKTWEACRVVEQEGLSYREAKRVVESNLFLDEYPRWDLGSPHQSVILHEMFLHAESWGQKEVEPMCHWGCQSLVREPNSKEDQYALHLIGYHTSQKELQDVYHSVYLLNWALGFPSCGEVKRKRVIREILSSLQERLRRQTPFTDAKDAPENKMDLAPPPTYEAALWDVRRKVMETAASLQDNLDRLDNELRGRPLARSQSRTWHKTWSRVSVEDSPEAKVECNLRVDIELKLEVRTRNALGVDLGTEQEPGLRIAIRLTSEMNGPVLETVSGNPKIEESALECLKARIWWQRTGNLPLSHLLRT